MQTKLETYKHIRMQLDLNIDVMNAQTYFLTDIDTDTDTDIDTDIDKHRHRHRHTLRMEKQKLETYTVIENQKLKRFTLFTAAVVH